MKNRNLITKYLILILPLLFMSLNAQDDVDPVEAASQAKAVAEAAEAVALRLMWRGGRFTPWASRLGS